MNKMNKMNKYLLLGGVVLVSIIALVIFYFNRKSAAGSVIRTGEVDDHLANVNIHHAHTENYITENMLKEQLAAYQPKGKYVTRTLLNETAEWQSEGLASKQPKGDYITRKMLKEQLAAYQPTGKYVTRTLLNGAAEWLSEGIASKQPKGDYITRKMLETNNAFQTAVIASKQPKGDYITRAEFIRQS